jgi:hypothetical protein
MAFYQTYMARWPDYCHVAEAPNGSIMGYSKPLNMMLIVAFFFEVLCRVYPKP